MAVMECGGAGAIEGLLQRALDWPVTTCDAAGENIAQAIKQVDISAVFYYIFIFKVL